LPAYFVIRAKDNLAFRRVASNSVDKSTGLRADQTIVFTTWQARHDYPETLRRVVFYDSEQQRRLVFLTNHFGISAKMVADIYKSRWQIELFFDVATQCTSVYVIVHQGRAVQHSLYG
jgi:hypothetical protein